MTTKRSVVDEQDESPFWGLRLQDADRDVRTRVRVMAHLRHVRVGPMVASILRHWLDSGAPWPIESTAEATQAAMARSADQTRSIGRAVDRARL